MYVLAQIAMLAWVPAVLLLFALLPPRRAVIAAFIGGMLFLPVTTFKLPILPDCSKLSAIGISVLFASLIFDSQRVWQFRPRWFDLPMLVYCCSPMASSMMNGLGAWDGVSFVVAYTATWGLPYFIGRIYFTDVEAVRELAIGVVIGGLVYIPFCLFEVRMSPQLHNLVYGSNTRGFQVRFGGWRPSVFMEHGLELALWMSVASLTGLWLWWTRSVRKIAGVSLAALLVPLLLTTVLCRSTGALILLLGGAGVLVFSTLSKTRIALMCLVLVVPAYIAVRATGIWSGDEVVRLAAMLDEGRAQSFQTRLTNENMLVEKALERPIFGWGGWGRSRVFDTWGNDISLTDGLWVLALGINGFVGLICLTCVLSLPLWLFVRSDLARNLSSPRVAPVLVTAICITLYAIDCLSNAMINPIYMLAGGAVASVVAAGQRAIDFETNNEPTPNVHASIPRRRLHSGCNG
jgi:hypothetical protein